jgi:signal transduction histidine kinase
MAAVDSLVAVALWKIAHSYAVGASAILQVLTVLAVPLLLLWGHWLVAGWLLRPLRTIAETVRRLGPQNLGQRIGLVSGNDALKELADALDDALDRLAAGYEGQRRFAANASHELRTPLAVQRVLTEVAMENPAAGEDLQRLGVQLLRTNERNERLIEGLLVLAESDRGLPGKVPVRLDELAGKVLEVHRELAGKREVELRRVLRPRVVPGDPVLLERLVTNLMTNAITYNEPGGWVEVSVKEGQPALTVANTGEHIPAEAVGTLFDPFRRLGADRVSHVGGVGLGLSIVRSVVTAHSGTIRAEARPEGGLSITIDLPAKVY